MAKYGMLIDLHKCVGCGACMIACKIENNVPEGFFWHNYIYKMQGTFPNVKYEFIPIQCNHCEIAPCVKTCPVEAMYKAEGGLTANDPKKCIGCGACIIACPYQSISFNKKAPHEFWRNNEKLIEGGTSSPKEVAQKTGAQIPYYNHKINKTYVGIRPKGIVEKCTFCDHRILEGKDPYCVEACPTKAKVFGDLNQPASQINQLLYRYGFFRLREELRTKPRVFYARGF